MKHTHSVVTIENLPGKLNFIIIILSSGGWFAGEYRRSVNLPAATSHEQVRESPGPDKRVRVVCSSYFPERPRDWVESRVPAGETLKAPQ
jgi:hypothetical protein